MYNVNSGGEEVLLDVAGQDATEAFEDVGHSDEAREILSGLQVAKLKRQVNILSDLYPIPESRMPTPRPRRIPLPPSHIRVPATGSSLNETAERTSSSLSNGSKVACISDTLEKKAEEQIKEATHGLVTQLSPIENPEAKMARMMAEAQAYMAASAARSHPKYYPVQHLRWPELNSNTKLVSSTHVLQRMKTKRDVQAGDPKPNLTSSTSTATKTSDSAAGFGIAVYAIIVLGGVLAFGAYKYFESQQVKA